MLAQELEHAVIAQVRLPGGDDMPQEAGVRRAKHLLAERVFDPQIQDLLFLAIGSQKRDRDEVGFDDLPMASRVWPNLTTVRLPIRDMGAFA
ncbi:MAG TPA: hypothetical protein PK954_22445, partial [Anaerolineales bacterium]|nr:hypothetical protein [Anaerolineales bacterium]